MKPGMMEQWNIGIIGKRTNGRTEWWKNGTVEPVLMIS